MLHDCTPLPSMIGAAKRVATIILTPLEVPGSVYSYSPPRFL